MIASAAPTSTPEVSALEFLGQIFNAADIIEFRCFADGKPARQFWTYADEVGPLLSELLELNGQGYHVHPGINPRREFNKSGDDNALLARCIFADFDGVTLDDALERIRAAGLPHPSIIVASGHGYHFYWLLAEPVTDMAVWTAIQTGLAALVKSDPVVVNPERLMRLPGTMNQKPPAAACTLIECEGTRFEWAEILPLIPKTATAEPAKENGARNAPLSDSAPIRDGKRNVTLASLAGSMRRRGASQNAIESALLVENSTRCEHPLPDDDVRRIAKSVSRYAPGENGQAEPVPEPLPEITPLRELWKSDPELREPIIDGILRRGQVGNLVSVSKAYKTFLVLALAVCMAMKGFWLDVFRTAGGRVLIIDLELQRPDITKRTHEICRALHAPPETADAIDVLSFRGRDGCIERIEALLLAIPPRTYSLVILDPLYKCYPAMFDENSNAQMTALYRRFERIAEHLDCALVIVHHATKGSQSEKRVVDVGAGAGSQSRSADGHIALREHETDGCVVFDARVRSFAPPPPLVLRFTYPLWERDLSLDPAALKTGRAARNTEKDDTPKEKPQPWTVERFIAEFLTSDPRDKQAIIGAAALRDVSQRKADQLIRLALDEKRIHRWSYAGKNTVYLATIPQPLTELGAAT